MGYDNLCIMGGLKCKPIKSVTVSLLGIYKEKKKKIIRCQKSSLYLIAVNIQFKENQHWFDKRPVVNNGKSIFLHNILFTRPAYWPVESISWNVRLFVYVRLCVSVSPQPLPPSPKILF